MYLRNFTLHLLAVSTSIFWLQFLKFLLNQSFIEFVSRLVYILEKVDQHLLPYRKIDNTSKFNEVCISNETFLFLQALFSFWKTFFTLPILYFLYLFDSDVSMHLQRALFMMAIYSIFLQLRVSHYSISASRNRVGALLLFCLNVLRPK